MISSWTIFLALYFKAKKMQWLESSKPKVQGSIFLSNSPFLSWTNQIIRKCLALGDFFNLVVPRSYNFCSDKVTKWSPNGKCTQVAMGKNPIQVPLELGPNKWFPKENPPIQFQHFKYGRWPGHLHLFYSKVRQCWKFVLSSLLLAKNSLLISSNVPKCFVVYQRI